VAAFQSEPSGDLVWRVSAVWGARVVLTVAKISAGGGAAYAAYLEGRTAAPEQGDYYLKDGEPVESPGRWALGPEGASALGVDRARPVEGDAFRSVMAVRHPVTGEPLRRVGANGEAVVAIDGTFSAPKSVSAVWALGSPEVRSALEGAQERAVDRALAHAVEYVPMVRRRIDEKTVIREHARDVLASSWQHTTARAVAGRAPDPQLHSHLLIHGALRSDGKVVAVESRAWMVHQREIGAAYRSELARELRELGFVIETGTGRGNRYFEIAGVPDGLRERWSSRHHQVQHAIELRIAEKRAALEAVIAAGGPEGADAAVRLDGLERSGRLMPAEERRFAISSRAAKGSIETAGDLDRAWWETAVEHGFDARTVEAMLDQGRDQAPVERDLEREVLGRLTEFDATFAPREARAVALEVAGDLGPQTGLLALDELRERGELLELADGRETTRAHRALEHATVARATELAAGRVEAIAPALVDRQVRDLADAVAEQGGVLAGEQELAVRAASGDSQLVVIVGQAGTGKSTALVGVARAHEQAGQRIVVVSTGAQAAERLAGELRDAGVNARGYSTTALRANVENERVALDAKVTVLHDEAALASTREQAWIIERAADSGSRLVMIGDPRQSQAVGAGGLWPEIERLAREQDGLVELSRIVRARDPADRRDQALFRSGQHEHSLTGYVDRGRVVVAREQRVAEDRALDGAQADRSAGRRTLVIAQTSNEQLDGLNARAQAIRLQEGELGSESVPLVGRPYALHQGDEIVVRAPVRHQELGPVRNGTTGEVAAVDERGQVVLVRLTDGREARFDRGLLDQAQVRLDYVSHPFPAQGRTTDTTHLIAGPLSTAEGSYVGVTRAREQTHIYAATEALGSEAGRDQLAGVLAEQLGRSEPEIPSIRIPLAHEQRVEREHAQQTLDEAEPTVAQAKAERDRLREIHSTYPREQADLITKLKKDLKLYRDALPANREHAERLRRELDALPVRERQSARAVEIEGRIHQSELHAYWNGERERGALTRLEELRAGPDSPERWQAEHPTVDRDLDAAERTLDRVVEREVDQRLKTPGEHITGILGPQPEPDTPERETWDKGARAIEAYRVAHEIDPTEQTGLGSMPELTRDSWEQWGDWQKAGEAVLDARERLGIARQGLGPTEERIARVEGLIPEDERERHLDRGHGWEI
jgi:conjugative relaxase-like TrwC/TraI family protein